MSVERSHRARRLDRVTIGILPNDVLMEVFYFYMSDWDIEMSEWYTLVHVKDHCPEMLDVWPVFPVAIRPAYPFSKSRLDTCLGNMAAALESDHHHHICEMELPLIPTSHWERLAAAMQKPFPQLTLVRILVEESTVASLSDSFLGGSAPLLQHLSFRTCSFPGMPRLLLSAIHLVTLRLWNIPDSGYFSPQALGTALSVMSRLETLRVDFQSPRPRPDPASRPPPPLTRSVLPALTRLSFQGVHEYLEDLLAQIQAPLLNKLEIVFFMDLNFVVPQLHQLISDAESFKTCDKALVYTSHRSIGFVILKETNKSPELSLELSCRVLDYQVSALAQVCSSSLPLLSTLVHLEIEDSVLPDPQSYWKDDMETAQWLELLDPFIAVKNLHLSNQFARQLWQALEELAEERVTEVLPALRNIFLSGHQSRKNVMKRFVTARRLSGHPVAVYRWENQRKLL
ncbi:hypothetical protein F5148DRAFT_1280124 [Russula earlei]|uniref:Uncharacterized protein n=1 Tax=Russula earlei TaxID=71964 RepID=A0ACC0UK95_9AGAM|nr:hypothetical protein F5148DRAFT_1280124 [Russula earlei]